MDTKKLSYVLAIAEHGSLSSAAAAVGISQPALSKYLSGLEDELGVELFWSHKKQLYPTGAGQIYLDAARKIIEVKEQTYQSIAALSEGYRKTIRVGVTPLRGAAAIATTFPTFHLHYPNVDIELKEMYPAELHSAVLNRSIDMALRTNLNSEDKDVRYISTHEEDAVLFVPSFHPLAPLASSDPDHPVHIEIDGFADTPFLVGKKGSTLREAVDLLFDQINGRPTIAYESDNNLILRNMALNGAGVALLPDSLIEPNEKLVYFKLKPNLAMHMSIMVMKDRELDEDERFLIALISAFNFTIPYYRYNPTPEADEIMKEFDITETSFTDLSSQQHSEYE